MSKNKPRIGIIIGTNRPTRIGRNIAEWLSDSMKTDDLEIELIDLVEVNLPFLDEPETPDKKHYVHDHTKAWSKTIKKYDGFVLLFPQYNWGYPAVIKNALDFLYDEWNGKPVSMVCYGGHGGFQGSLAMSLVTKGLNMRTMTANIPLNIDEEMFDHQNQFKDIDKALSPYKYSAQQISDEFVQILAK